MGRSPRKAVQKYHDRVAHQYDDIYDDLFWKWHDTLTWDYLKPYLPARTDQRLIDLGCGTGKWGLRLAHSGYPITCLDVSHKMVDVVRRKVAGTPLEHRVDCVPGDLMDLSALPAEHYALALAMGEPLCSVESPARALKEIRRLLIPGGLLVATVDNRLNALDYYLDKGDLAGLERLVKTGKTHWLTRERSEQFELCTFTPRQIVKLLAHAQFTVRDIKPKTVLAIRPVRHLLENKSEYRKLLALEKRLARDGDALGRAAHLQFAAQKEGAS